MKTSAHTTDKTIIVHHPILVHIWVAEDTLIGTVKDVICSLHSEVHKVARSIAVEGDTSHNLNNSIQATSLDLTEAHHLPSRCLSQGSEDHQHIPSKAINSLHIWVRLTASNLNDRLGL
jgi:hypothetical protein